MPKIKAKMGIGIFIYLVHFSNRRALRLLTPLAHFGEQINVKLSIS